MPGTFEIKKTTDDQYHFILKAPNNEPILQSERYTTKQSAQNGIASIMENAPGADIQDVTGE